MTMVKICGITRLEDALVAADAGADWLGFVFYPVSKRYIQPKTCMQIVNELSRRNFEAVFVGVFVNEDLQNVQEIMAYCGLNLAQLHGEESEADLEVLKPRSYKAIRPKNQTDLDYLLKRYSSPERIPQVLVDTYHESLKGGSGRVGDWMLAREAARRYPILLAGGLTPENVKDAIQQVCPWGVDVSSGVESHAGIKDSSKIKAFVRNAKGI
jgi:phosphoribosylanthranilate isomerase